MCQFQFYETDIGVTLVVNLNALADDAKRFRHALVLFTICRPALRVLGRVAELVDTLIAYVLNHLQVLVVASWLKRSVCHRAAQILRTHRCLSSQLGLRVLLGLVGELAGEVARGVLFLARGDRRLGWVDHLRVFWSERGRLPLAVAVVVARSRLLLNDDDVRYSS